MIIEKIGKSLGSVIDERLSSPLVSGFVISWSIINWKFIAVLLSKNTVSKTIELADGLYPSAIDWFGWNVVAPLTAALAYVYLLPLLSRRVTKQWRENQKLVEDDRKAVEELELLDLQTSRKIRADIYQLSAKIDEVSSDRDEAREQAKTAVKAQVKAERNRAEAEKELSDTKDRIEGLSKQLETVSTEAKKRMEELRRAQTASQRLLALLDVAEDDLRSMLDRKDQRPASLIEVLIPPVLRTKGLTTDLLSFRALSILYVLEMKEPLTIEELAEKTKPASAESIRAATDELLEGGLVGQARSAIIGQTAGFVLTNRGKNVIASAHHYDEALVLAKARWTS